jgi:acyl-coenzyme A thioesterase PaaI-like protein
LETAHSSGEVRSFVSGEPEGERLRVRYFERIADGALVGKAWFGPKAEGPPGYAHGGALAALIDEITGGAAWLAGHPVVAARLVVNFRRRLPLGEVTRFSAWVSAVDGRKVTASAKVVSDEGDAVYAEGENLLVVLDPRELGEGPPEFAARMWRRL